MLNKIRENMKAHRPPVPVILLVLTVLAVAVWLIVRGQGEQDGTLKASGTIEGITVNISSEMSGRVQKVLVEQGQAVRTGDPLLRLDESLLAAQRAYAAAGVESATSAAQTAQTAYASAQAQYDITLTAARAADNQARIADWIGKRPDYFDQPAWYFTRDEQIAAAEVEVSAAESGLKAAQADLDKVVQDLYTIGYLAAETRLANARIAYLVASDVNARAQLSEQEIQPENLEGLDCPPGAPCYRIKIALAKRVSGQDENLLDAAQDMYDAAKLELEDAQKVYNDLLSTQAAIDVQAARANVILAQERLEITRDRLSMLRAGVESLQVTAAALQVEQARAAAAQAEDVVKQAEANLALLDTQMAKLEVNAPTDGVVLNRSVEPGEFIQPGAAAIELVRLDSLTITVYVPEDRYGRIHLGQSAAVSVDSFPGETFAATVVYISDRAEFTPRNIQTVEGRSSTVYAIKLRLDDPGGKLKPGMPADVIFR